MAGIPFNADDFEVDEATLKEIGERYLTAIQQNVKAGFNAAGEALPPGVDLYRTGNMLYRQVSVEVNVEKAEVNVSFNTDYAKKNQERFNFAGLPAAKTQEFLEGLASLGSGVHSKGTP